MKLNKKWGFTLIEIMIVIVIISLLAVTLVPKLTGAQARARDASRTASLMQMKAVLIAYYDDFSEFPHNTHTANPSDNWDYCLSNDSKWNVTAWSALEDYVETQKTSFDPQKTAKVWPCVIQWSLWYIALMKNWSESAAFVLSAQTETYQKSNTIYKTSTLAKDGSDDINTIIGDWKTFDNTKEIGDLKTADKASAITTIYTVTWG